MTQEANSADNSTPTPRSEAAPSLKFEHTPGPYYVKGARVFKQPIHTENDDGSTSVALGFPVCSMHETVGEEGASIVAELMNRGDHFDDMLAALQAILPFIPVTSASEGGASKFSQNVRAADMVRAAISKATGAQQS